MSLPAELRNQIFEAVLPRRAWITVHDRRQPSGIAILQVCRAIRANTLPMYYGNNIFAMNLRTPWCRSLTHERLNSLSPAAIGALRILHFTSILQCSCTQAQRRSLSGSLVTITIDRHLEEEPFSINVRFCTYCDDRPVHIASQAWCLLHSMELEDEIGTLIKADMFTLLELLKPRWGVPC